MALAHLRSTRKPNRRTRKVYRLTQQGDRRLHDLLTDDTDDDERTFALKLVFCRHLDVAARLSLLERRRAALSRRLARADRSGPGRSDRYTRSLFEHRDESTRRDLEWIERLIVSETPEGAADAVGPRTSDTRSQGATAS
jgi:hypothetical protein